MVLLFSAMRALNSSALMSLLTVLLDFIAGIVCVLIAGVEADCGVRRDTGASLPERGGGS